MSIEITVLIALATLASGAFWRMWALIAEAKSSGDVAQRQLAEYKAHAAEHFATKDGMQRQTDQLLRAIESVASRIDGLNERLDRAFESNQRRRTS